MWPGTEHEALGNFDEDDFSHVPRRVQSGNETISSSAHRQVWERIPMPPFSQITNDDYWSIRKTPPNSAMFTAPRTFEVSYDVTYTEFRLCNQQKKEAAAGSNQEY